MEDEHAPKLTSQAAIQYIIDEFEVKSLYGIAQSLSDEELTVQPT